MKNLERVRWRCRRGMLELDIILERFVTRYYMQLSEAELLAFEELLDKPDNSLWDLIAGRQAVVQQPELMLLQKIRLV